MTEPRSFGTPSITGSTVEELRRSVQFWLQQMANHLDTQAGLRGTPALYGPLDARGHTIHNVGDPVDENGAVPARLAMTSRSNPDQGRAVQWDAQGQQIFNLPAGVGPAQAVNVSQLDDTTQKSLLAAGATAPPPSVAATSLIGSTDAGYAFGDHTHGTTASVAPPAVSTTGSVGSGAAGLAFGDHTHALSGSPTRETYALTGSTPQRTYDVGTAVLADVLNTLATLVADLRALGLIL